MRAVAEIAAHAAVKMQIDQSGHGVQTAHIHRHPRSPLADAIRSPEMDSPPVLNVPSG